MSRAALAAAVLAAAALAGAACDDVCDGPACASFTGECDGAAPRLGLEHRWSIRTDETANPELVGFIPGGDGRAIATSRQAARITEVLYDEDRIRFGEGRSIALANSSSELTSVWPAPSGQFAAVTVSDNADGDTPCYEGAVIGCACGSVMFVDLRPGKLGTALGSIPVGYTPDGGRFSADGRYLVIPDEDDGDDLPCKPEARNGGSVSVIELGADPQRCQTTPAIELPGGQRACRIAQVPVLHHKLAEPEDASITLDGTVVFSIQETDEVGVFDLADLEVTRIPLSPNAGPDGTDVSPDGRFAAVALEHGDAIVVVDLARRAVAAEHRIVDDVPGSYNRDERDAIRMHEPEQVVWFESEGVPFIAMTLQESHAVIAYRVDVTTDGGVALVFDSIAPVGVEFAAELGGEVASMIGPEGLAVRPRAGGRSLLLSANEREGSLTLLRSSCPR